MSATYLVVFGGLVVAVNDRPVIQDMRNDWNTNPSNFHVSFLFQDVLTLIGEALRSFPKPSEDPKNLWQKLKGQKM